MIRARAAGWIATLALAGGVAAAGDLSEPDFRKTVAQRIPGVTAADIGPSPVPGIYEVRRGRTLAYITADGRYLFDGDLIAVASGENLSDAARRERRREALAAVPASDMLVFEPAQPRHTLTVFTDVNCPHCRRLHAAIDQLLAAGIRVRYLFYPLEGPGSEGFRAARAVWCAAEPRAALGRAMRGETVALPESCETPLRAHLRLATRTLDLPGTPAMILGDGRLLPGTLSPAAVIRAVAAAGP